MSTDLFIKSKIKNSELTEGTVYPLRTGEALLSCRMSWSVLPGRGKSGFPSWTCYPPCNSTLDKQRTTNGWMGFAFATVAGMFCSVSAGGSQQTFFSQPSRTIVFCLCGLPSGSLPRTPDFTLAVVAAVVEEQGRQGVWRKWHHSHRKGRVLTVLTQLRRREKQVLESRCNHTCMCPFHLA